jgi:putative transposase
MKKHASGAPALLLDRVGEPAASAKLILFSAASPRRTLTDFLKHYHHERNHQGKKNVLLFPAPASPPSHPDSAVTCHERLGGLLKFYQHAA